MRTAAILLTGCLLAGMVCLHGQRRLFAAEEDLPARSWVLEGWTDSVARARIGESLAGRTQGIWQATADGARVAIVADDAPGQSRSDATGYNAPGNVLIVMLDSPRPGIRPGTVAGWASPAATPGRWDARMFTRTDGRELTSPRRFVLTLADDNHLTLTPASDGVKISLHRLLPYFFRSALRQSNPPDGMEGFLRLWPTPAGSAPLNPVYL